MNFVTSHRWTRIFYSSWNSHLVGVQSTTGAFIFACNRANFLPRGSPFAVYFLASHIESSSSKPHTYPYKSKKVRIVSVLYLYKALHWVLEETHFPSLSCVCFCRWQKAAALLMLWHFFSRTTRARACSSAINKQKGSQILFSPAVRKARSWMRGGCLLICLPAAPHRLEIGYWVKTWALTGRTRRVCESIGCLLSRWLPWHTSVGFQN